MSVALVEVILETTGEAFIYSRVPCVDEWVLMRGVERRVYKVVHTPNGHPAQTIAKVYVT